MVNCIRLGYQQVIHILPSMQAPKVLDLKGYFKLPGLSIPNQCNPLDRCIYSSVQDKPVFPSTHGGGILDCSIHMLPTFNLQDRIVLTLLAQTPLIKIRSVCSFTLSLHVVGIVVCLVTLHTKSVRRASHCPLYRVRNFSLTHRPTTLPNACILINFHPHGMFGGHK